MWIAFVLLLVGFLIFASYERRRIKRESDALLRQAWTLNLAIFRYLLLGSSICFTWNRGFPGWLIPLVCLVALIDRLIERYRVARKIAARERRQIASS